MSRSRGVTTRSASATAATDATPNDNSNNSDASSHSAGASGGKKSGKLRGGYRCSLCGRPKKGHVCPTSSSSNLTFIGFDDSADVLGHDSRREDLLKRVEELEKEVELLTEENVRLKSALQQMQGNQNAMGPFGAVMAPDASWQPQHYPQHVHAPHARYYNIVSYEHPAKRQRTDGHEYSHSTPPPQRPPDAISLMPEASSFSLHLSQSAPMRTSTPHDYGSW